MDTGSVGPESIPRCRVGRRSDHSRRPGVGCGEPTVGRDTGTLTGGG